MLNPAPLLMLLGFQALKAMIKRLEERIADYKSQKKLAVLTDIKN
ncbi:hypothetical protein [Propionispira raffinosivorans]|nr:hypothetical protein [Propionispira raffinosivorans]